MRSELIDGVTVRSLRNGDADTVQAVFESLGLRSRLSRFGGTKTMLTRGDLQQLARVDARHHVLVALHDCRPIGIARLVRDGNSAEVAVEVADAWQGRRVGTLLMSRLAEDARAAGIERLHAFVAYDNVVSRRLMRRASVRVSTA
jgi:L-amino acid N-acyltransferase YncA